MEFRALEYFIAVAEERHFTRAAARVHVSQSGLSATIRSLESELHEDLFERTTRRVRLTEAGEAFVPAARRALAAAREVRTMARSIHGWPGTGNGQLRYTALIRLITRVRSLVIVR